MYTYYVLQVEEMTRFWSTRKDLNNYSASGDKKRISKRIIEKRTEFKIKNFSAPSPARMAGSEPSKVLLI